MDGGIRVPTVIRFPGILPRGKVIDEPTQQLDMFTTITKLIGGKIPKDRVIDGKDVLPLLQFKESKSPHQFMYHYCGEHLQATRYRPPQGTCIWLLHFVTHITNIQDILSNFRQFHVFFFRKQCMETCDRTSKLQTRRGQMLWTSLYM